jgi:hypothetical protein
MRREVKLGLSLAVLLTPLAAAGAGLLLSNGVLHPMRNALTREQIDRADRMAARVSATREDFNVRAVDAIMLRGWKMRPAQPNGDWVLLLHGVSDNRAGMIGFAEFLLRRGYSVVLMDARAHGASQGDAATYGWLERHDVRYIVDALYAGESVHCLFALGESMGASTVLQAAAIEPRIAGVVAESAFANLREVSFDYAGLRFSHWLGKTLFRPASTLAIRGAEKEGGFDADDVSPEKAVAERPFPVFLICGLKDRNIPARHTKRIYKAAIGPREMWLVPEAGHTVAYGTAPAEFERRVVRFYEGIHQSKAGARK